MQKFLLFFLFCISPLFAKQGKLITKFHLKPGKRVGIAPNRKPTIFINSSRLTFTESVAIIKQHIESI